AEVWLDISPDGKHLLVTVQKGDGGEFEHFLVDPAHKITRITRYEDKVTAAAFGPGDTLYLVSLKDAPRGKMIRLPVANPKLAEAKTIVPESEVTVQGFRWGTSRFYANFVTTADRLYVVDLVGGPSRIRVFDLDGRPQKGVLAPPISSAGQVLAWKDGEIVFRSETFIDPPAWYVFDPSAGKVKKTALFRASPADFSDSEVVREFAMSKDGTRVPLNIIRKKGTELDGKNPTILYGYGGYGSSQVPRFNLIRRVWLEQGGVYAIANLRGGGEFGEEWHRAGNLTKKQNVFDDFIACAEYLIDKKYTNPDKLAIMGGSNGGLLMGAALTQRPELFRAVVSFVGIYDMLRVELHANGAFNVTEFGSVKDPEQFKALYAYSPYHGVKGGTAYPAIFLLTGENDGRVDPHNSRKMTARLQAATSSKHPVLLRTSSSAGHGIGSSLSETIAENADVFAFLFHELGVNYK
ncbi:MAG TPA: prolyl oligopeptidase family serine peptidase, partial [Gemmataceae bacterium]|nr:prolyl oligopeptidase family serine peptidase [Gemmataceae bacterium]